MRSTCTFSRLLGSAAVLLGLTGAVSAQTTTYTFTASVQTYTVPASITSLAVDMIGARGGDAYDNNSAGGLGGRVQCTLNVTPGQVLYVYVGGQGAQATGLGTAPGGYNGGGIGGPYGGGGGGATDIRTDNGPVSPTNRLVVAGGGGGGSWNCSNETGGAGGGLVGGNGMNCSSNDPSYNGAGGTQTAGGAGATSGGEDGSLGQGGNYITGTWGSAGGAGYYGGGSGYYGSGGGGSSYTNPLSVPAGVLTQGYSGANGDGMVSITPLNALPVFDNGATQNISLCEGIISANISTYLSMSDANAGNTETFTVISGPMHGSVGGFPTSLTATGGTDAPSGLTYMPGTGYVGMDTVQVEVSDGAGGADTTTLYITIHALPVVYNVTGTGSYCEGSSGIPVGLSSSESGTTYRLYNGATLVGTQTGTGAAISFGSYTTAATYTATATSIHNCMADMTGSATISITPTVAPMVGIFSVDGDTACAGSIVTLTGIPTNGGPTPAYEWHVNGGPVIGAAGSFTLVPTDGDVVSVHMTSSAACPVPATVTNNIAFTVLPMLTPAVTVTAMPGGTVCQHSTVFFMASGVNGGTTPVYTWTKNGVPVPSVTGTLYSTVPADNDVIAVKLNSSYGCTTANDVASNNITMDVSPAYLPAVTLAVTPGYATPAGQSVTVNATVSAGGPAPTYQWIKNGVAINGATRSSYSSSSFTNGDSLTVVVFGTGICSFSTFNSVILRRTTGVNEINTTNNLAVAPNPSKGTFTVRGTIATSADGNIALQVVNMLGQVVYNTTATTNGGQLQQEVTLDNNLPDGIYLLQVSTGAAKSSHQLMIKH